MRMPAKSTLYLSKTIALIAFGLVAFTYSSFANHTDTPLKFIENKGQWNKEVRYAADIPGGRMFLTQKGITYGIADDRALDQMFHHFEDNSEALTAHRKTSLMEVQRVSVEFTNSNTQSILKPSEVSTEHYNFFLGKDKTKWATNCKAYAAITYKDLYPNIDLKVYVGKSGLKYDLILHKGAEPSLIGIQYTGADNLMLKDGQIQAFTKFNRITENRPFAYQVNKNGVSKQVDCQYRLQNNQVTFEFSKGYHKDETLIIDPELIFSTFSGSRANNFGFTACYDTYGNLYSGGNVFGLGFPVTNGSNFMGVTSDIGILKYDSSGVNLLYATYIGGNSEEAPHSLLVNNNNELVIMGSTGSSNYPVSNDAYDTSFNGGTLFNIFGPSAFGSDIVVTKLDESGSLIASTFVGGPGNDGILKLTERNTSGYINKLIRNYGDYLRGDIIMDADDNLYIASSSDSIGFPVTSNIQPNYGGGNSDGVVFSLTSDLSNLRWSTYLGGTDDDAAHSIKLDDQDNVVVGGGTISGNFPTTLGVLNNIAPGGIDGFITKLSQSGDSILYSTYLGTSEYDQVYFIDIDQGQNIYAFGQTKGSYPITNGTFNNPNSGQFIHKMNNDLSSTIFSTIFGSGQPEPNISPTAFLVNECDNIFLSGWGGSLNNGTRSVNAGNTFNLPTTDDALFRTTDGSDFYLMALSADGKNLLYGTFFGNTNGPTGDHVDGGTSRFDKKGIIYQSVCSCGGGTDNFPTTPGAWSNFNFNQCNNAAFKFDLASLKARIQTNSISQDAPGINNGCIPFSILFENNSVGGEEFQWDFGDGSTSDKETNIVHIYEEPGVYTVTLTARDENTCLREDIASTTIFVHENNFTVSDSFQICEGEEVLLSATGGVDYTWSKAKETPFAMIASTVVSPDSTTVYRVNVTNENGCNFQDSVKVTVIPLKVLDFDVTRENNCTEEPILSFKNRSTDEVNFEWDFGDGTFSIDFEPNHQYEEFGSYTVRLTSRDADCVIDKFEVVDHQDFFVPNVFTPNADGVNDLFEIRSNIDVQFAVFDRSGKQVFTSTNYKNDWNGGNWPSGVYYYELTFPNGETCNSWLQILR